MSKYDALWMWIKENRTDSFRLSFDEIQQISGVPIDHSFLTYKKELAAYGYAVKKISMKAQTVEFQRVQCQDKHIVIYIHGKGGNADEAEHYKPLFPGCDVIGFDYRSQTPWEARSEFPKFFDEKREIYDEITLIANSIGAFFSMNALTRSQVDQALFISPIVDMEKLIADMMMWSNVTEEELRVKKEIPTEFGETLSWDYLCDVRSHPAEWKVPTHILYGVRDHLTSAETIRSFAERTGASLTVMESGEHWFHTEEQMEFLDRWIGAKR